MYFSLSFFLLSLKSSQLAVLNLLILLINHNALYKTVLREAGLMDVMVVALKHYSTSLKDAFDGTIFFCILKL